MILFLLLIMYLSAASSSTPPTPLPHWPTHLCSPFSDGFPFSSLPALRRLYAYQMNPEQWRSTSTPRSCLESCTMLTHSANGSLGRRPNSAPWILKRSWSLDNYTIFCYFFFPVLLQHCYIISWMKTENKGNRQINSCSTFMFFHFVYTHTHTQTVTTVKL